MNCIASERRSPLWNKNDESSSQRSGAANFVPINVVPQSSYLSGAISLLSDVEKGLKNYSLLSVEDCQELSKILNKIKKIIIEHKLEILEPRLNKVAKGFEEIKKQDLLPALFLDIQFLEANFSNPLEKITDEVPFVYKGLCDYFSSLDHSRITPEERSLVNGFNPIYFQIQRLIKESLSELDFVEEGVFGVANEEMSEKQIALMKQAYEVIVEKIHKYIGFMSLEDQAKVRGKLVEIESVILSFTSRTSPNSIVDCLNL